MLYVDYIQDPMYFDVLYRKFEDAAKMALDDLHPAALSVAEAETPEPLSFVRRYVMKDGSIRTNPGSLNPDIVRPADKSDNAVRLMRFTREGAGDIALISFSTHADVISGSKFSADWPGFVRRMTEAALPGVRAISMAGFQGDVNHTDVDRPAPANGYEHSRYMGRVITDTALSLWDKTRPVKDGHLWSRILVRNVHTNTNGADRIEEVKEIYRRCCEKTLGYKLGFEGKAEAGRIAMLDRAPLFQKLIVSCVGFGDCAIVGVNGEPFTRFATEIRAAFPELFLMTVCLTNGGEAYFPTADAYAEGGYEARVSPMDPEAAPMLSAALTDVMTEYRQQLK